MNKTVAFILSIVTSLSAPGWLLGQDLLTNPQNQKYLFTSGTDETQAFLYNPAYLGLYNRGEALDGYYFYPSKSMLVFPDVSFHDIGIFGQTGKFGLAYRNAESSEEILNQYSAGLGFGNERAAVGVSLSLMSITAVDSRWFPSVGIILRPDSYVSFGAAYHNFSRIPFGYDPIEETTNIGVGIRPFGTDFLTLNADLITPVHNDGYKIGITMEPILSLKVYGIYDRSGYRYQPAIVEPQGNPVPPVVPPSMWANNFSIGVSFNFSPHIHVEGASSYQSGRSSGYAATYGRIMFTSQEMPTILFDHKIAEIEIKGKIPDEREQASLFFKPPRTLLDYVGEIKKCGDDPSIVALILKIYPYSTSEAFFALSGETQELSDAVRYVHSKGKKVYAYLTDNSSVDELYLASDADKVYMAPLAFISGYGVEMDLIRLKGLFDKLHISWNARTAGKYKSTFHTIYTDSASPEQAKLIRGLVDDVYLQMVKQIELNRGITMDDSLRSALSGIISSRDAARLHVIDGVSYYDEFKKDVNRDLLGTNASLAGADPWTMQKYETRWGKKPEVAVIGVYGDIVTGESSPPAPFPIPFFGSGRTSGSETVAGQIKSAASDNDIKSIVLRVNSGGGWALASDEIYNAIEQAKKEKPVIASFGNMAASGGYYVAAGTGKIFAEPATLTGSIGVVIDFPVLTDFFEKDLGSNVEEYRAGQNSGLLSPFHRWDSSDLRYVDEFLTETYDDFKAKVSEGRKLPLDRVEELAQGKVYTGLQAKPDRLIDEYGGLDRAIEYAAGVTGISEDYDVRVFTVPGLSFGSFFNIGAAVLQEVSNWNESNLFLFSK